MKFMRYAVGLTVLAAAVQAAVAQDRVTYRDRKADKTANFQGKITSETVGNVALKPSVGDPKQISAVDIIDIVYEVPAEVRLGPYPKAIKLETEGKTDEALREYTELLPKLNPTPLAARHVQFKIAMLKARLAEDDAAQAPAAVEALTKFKTEFPNSWQLVSVVRQLGRLLSSQGKDAEALSVYEALAKTPDLPKEAKQEADVLVIESLVRGGKGAEAKARIADAKRGLQPTDPQMMRLDVYEMAADAGAGKLEDIVTKLEAVIAKSPDAGLKALAYNALGDAYAANDRKKDAVWSHLWVDVVYNQDKTQHQKAVERLAKLFEELNDETRAKQFKDKAAKLR